MKDMTLIYDKECPLCNHYANFIRLKQAVGNLNLIDGRTRPDLVKDLKNRGYDINEGMILQMGDATWHGAEALHKIALMSTSSGAFNRLNVLLFSNETVARIAYPFLRAGRNLLLKLRGVPLIAHSD